MSRPNDVVPGIGADVSFASLEGAFQHILEQSHADLRAIFQQAEDARQEALDAKDRYDELCATMQSRFERASALSSSAGVDSHHGKGVVGFNVSGTRFVLRRDVVGCVADSVLSALISNAFPVDVDQAGDVRIDRHAEPFAHVAKYLTMRWDGMQATAAAARTTSKEAASTADAVLRVERMLRGLGMDELAVLREEAHFYALDELCLLCTHTQQRKFLLHYPFASPRDDVEGARCVRVDDASSGRILCVDVLSENNASLPRRNDGDSAACAASRWWLACAGTEAGALHFLSRPPLRAEIRKRTHSDAVTAVMWMGQWTEERATPKDSVLPRSTLPPSSSALMAVLSAGRDAYLKVTVVDAFDARPTTVVKSCCCPNSLGAPTSLAPHINPPRVPRGGSGQRGNAFHFISGHATGMVGFWRCVMGGDAPSSGNATPSGCCLQLMRTVGELGGGDRIPIRKLLTLRCDDGGHRAARRNDGEALLCVQGAVVERLSLATGAPIGAPLDAHVESVRCIAANPLLLATGCFAGNVFLWDVAACCLPTTSACSPSPRAALPPFESWIADMQFTKHVRPIDSLLCVAAGNTLSVAHPCSGALLRTVCLSPAHRDVVRCLFPLDGGLGIVTGSFDGSIIFWDGDAPDGCPLCCAPEKVR